MFLILLIFVIFSACLVISYRMKFAYIMSMYFLGCVALIISGFFYFLALSSYQYLNNVDYYMLRVLSNIKVDIYGASLIHNMGVTFFMSAAILCLHLVYTKKMWIKLLLLIPVIYVFYANLPSTDWSLYLKSYEPGKAGRWAVLTARFIRISSMLTAFAYLMAPVVIFGVYTAKTKIFVKKRYGLSCIACIFLIYIIVILLFIKGVFEPTMFYNTDLTNFPQKELGMYTEKSMIIMSIVCITIINFFIILYFKPFEKYGADSKQRFVKHSRIINENIFMLLHIYKNRFLGIEKLAGMGIKETNTNEIVRTFRSIEKESADSVENISKTLKMLNVLTTDYHVFVLESCIDEAVKRAACADIEVVKEYIGQKTVVLGSKEHITEAFLNIIRNAAEAIEQAGRKNGKIKINVYTEPDMLLACVADNGCGISKKDMHNIFKLFYTTKNQKVGNGLGLDFIKRVIGIHGGDVRISSEEDVGSEVYVALPIYKVTKTFR